MVNERGCLLIVQSSKFSRPSGTYLKLSGFPSIQPHFQFIVSNERSYFNEQESSALPTELTTQKENDLDYNNTLRKIQSGNPQISFQYSVLSFCKKYLNRENINRNERMPRM